MARTIDERVVSASFETSKFQAGVSSMLNGLDKLKKSMDFKNAGKGLDQINASAGRLNFGHISDGLGRMRGQFKNLEVVGIAVMANLATSAVGAGTRLVKAFTFQPVIDGLHEYENQLNSVQTILANTKSAGTNLKDVNGALDQLNEYSDKTIYNFGQMTKNIGTFTAAGVDLKTSVGSIKGISNLAALSGSSAEQASTAMYQLSQAISSGRVSLQDWNSVVNAGMGGAVFQRALAQTAQSMGKLKDGAVQLKGPMKNVSIEGKSFRESIQAKPGQTSWLTSDVLTNTLKQFSGDLSKAELKAQGFNDAQIKAIQAQAKTALEAATQVKTFTQLVDTTKEAIGSGWASTFEIIFGDFKEAKELWTGLAGVIGGFVKRSAEARNKMLSDWKEAGGRATLIQAFKQAFEDLQKILGPIGKAFRDIFPKKTGGQLASMTRSLLRFTQALEPSKETTENLRRTFRGFFAVLDIGKMIIGGIIGVIGKLFGTLGDGSGGFLNLTGNIGDFLVSLRDALEEGGKLNDFFEGLGNILSTPIVLIQKLAHAIGEAFGADGIGRAAESLGPLEKIIYGIEQAWDSFLGSVGQTREIAKPALEGLSEMVQAFSTTIAEALKGADFDAIFKVLQVGLLGGIFFTLKKALSGGLGNALAGGVLQSVVQAFTGVGGLSRSIGGTFDALTGSITTMQQNVKSDTLKNIAISIALLAASIIGLSFVDPKRLESALTAITIGFGQLLAAMAIMEKIGKHGGFIKMPIIAASMVILAGAINLLAIAVYAMSKLSWEELAKGLGAVAVLLGSISVASGPLSANAGGMIRAATGITIIAVAMNILAQAVQSFGGMDMATLAKGIGGISVALAGIGAAANLFPSGMVALGVGLIAVGAGLKLIVGTIQTLGDLDMSTLGKGIGGVAVALGAIGLAMRLMPGPSMVLTAAGLVLVGVALKNIAKAIGMMGSMSIEVIAKGLGTLAASLALLALGLYAMSGTLGGSAALVVAATGIAILAPALKILGEQSWGQIIKGMVALGVAFAVLGAAGLLLSPVVPAILGLGVALVAVGAGLALAGAGVALIGIGLSAVAVAGPAAVKILVAALVQLAEAIPKIIKSLVKALVALVEGVADAAPKFVKAIGKILVLMATAIITAAPQLEKAFIAIIDLILSVLRKETPNLIKTGFDMLKALLKGIAKNIGGVVKMVATIVAKFLGGIASNIGRIIGAGASILVAVLRGIANSIGRVASAATSIITSFLRGIANNIRRIVTAGGDIIVNFLRGISRNIGRVVTEAGRVIAGFIRGIGNAGSKIVKAGVDAATKFVRAVAKGAVKMADEGAKAVIRFLNGVADVIEKREPEMIAAGIRIGKAIVQGMINGIGQLAGALKKKAEDLITGLPKKALKVLGIKSPSQVFLQIGQNIVKGLVEGITDSTSLSTQAMATLAVSTTGAFTQKFGTEQGKILEQFFGVGEQAGVQFFSALLGIVESNDTVDQAMRELTSSLQQQIDDTKAKIKENRDAEKQANADIKQDWADLRQARKDNDKGAEANAKRSRKRHQDEKNDAIETRKANEKLLEVLKSTSKFINEDTAFETDRMNLKAYTAQFTELSKQIETAESNLESLKQEKSNFAQSKFEQYSALPEIVGKDEEGNDIDPATQVNNYIASLSNADDVVGNFTSTMDQLRGLGLNDETYKQLLDVGPAAQTFASELLKMGPSAVTAINNAETDLINASRTLADHSATALYDNMLYVGEKSAQGIVDGLKKQQGEVYKQMIIIATRMIKAIKKELKIKSPSQVFAEIGSYSVEGMATGFTKSSSLVTDAIYGVSDDAKNAIKRSMRGISDIVSDQIDPNPTITPVLDLSQIQAGVGEIGSIIPATASMSLASGISVPGIGDSLSETGQAAPIQFIQNNNSPKALSSIEIYRNTKNQLSQARPVLITP